MVGPQMIDVLAASTDFAPGVVQDVPADGLDAGTALDTATLVALSVACASGSANISNPKRTTKLFVGQTPRTRVITSVWARP